MNHYDDLQEVITFPSSLAQSLRSAKLISQQLADSILTNTLRETDRMIVARILKEIRVLIQYSKGQKQKTAFLSFCRVLSNEDSPALSVVAEQILEESGKLCVLSSHLIN